MRKPIVFLDGISGFMANVEMIRPDFTGERKAKFDELVAAIPKCKPQNRDEILKAIDDLCAYVEAA